MALRYKVDVLAALRDKGYNTGRLRKQKLLGESTIQKLRMKAGISWSNLNVICTLLECQPGDLIEHVVQKEYGRKDAHGTLTVSFDELEECRSSIKEHFKEQKETE